MIEQLKKAGLSEYEAKVYLALLELGPSDGIAISRKSNVPKTRVYDVLKDLSEKGLISLLQKRPLIFKAVKPETGLKHLFENRLEELKETEAEAIGALIQIKAKPKTLPQVHERITTVLGYERMYSTATEWLNHAKKSISVFSVGEEIPYSLRIALKRAIARGVKPRLIVTKCNEENLHTLKKDIADGWDVRHYPSTGEWTFSVYDTQKVMINVRNPKIKEERISTFFEVPGLAKALAEYYETIWKKAKPVKP